MQPIERGSFAASAHSILDNLAPGTVLSTGDLAKAIVGEDGDVAAACGYLRHAAKSDLRHYVTKGEPRPGRGFSKGRIVTPLLWSRSAFEGYLAPAETPALPSPAAPAEELLTYHEFHEKTDSVTAHFNATFVELEGRLNDRFAELEDRLNDRLDEILQRLEIFK